MHQTIAAAAARLGTEDARQVWDFLARFQENPAHLGHSLERVKRARSRDLWSARVTQSVRAILHKDGDTWLLMYVGPHDDAYRWAAQRRVERHAITGAVQVVVLPETAAESLREEGVRAAPRADAQPPLFTRYPDSFLISLGLPAEWLPAVREVRTDDDLLEIALHIPQEAAERLMDLAEGRPVTPPAPLPPDRPALESPDAQLRFLVVEDDEDFRRLLTAPLTAWAAFLHRTQRRLAEGSFNGPLKITGSAGTGKTTVALHRARHLARQGKPVLLTTFGNTLADNLGRSLELFCAPDELRRITTGTVHSAAVRLLHAAREPRDPIVDQDLKALIRKIAPGGAGPLSLPELLLEWKAVVEANGVTAWEAYRGVSRVGRGKALSLRERQLVWPIFERLQQQLERERRATFPGLCRLAGELLRSGRIASPYDAVIVDEVQDLQPQELRFLAALAGEGPDRLTLTGDGGQRIYQRGFSLRSLGIDVRGRSHVLRLNYRTTHQIRRFADRIGPATSDDLDGGQEGRRATRSLVMGPTPVLRGFHRLDEQHNFVAEKIAGLLSTGLAADEIAIFARHKDQLRRMQARLRLDGVPTFQLDQRGAPAASAVQLGTMHRAKGLEFKTVFVIDVSAEVLPAPPPEEAADEPAQQEALERERHLLYVSITRARDEVFVTWAGRPSQFLAGMV